jgi:hypothetical protein
VLSRDVKRPAAKPRAEKNMFDIIFSSSFPEANSRHENANTAMITSELVAYRPNPGFFVMKKPKTIDSPITKIPANDQVSNSISPPY